MITKEEVEHIALLARLHLSETEKETFAAQLGQIIEHAGKVAKIDTSKVEPTSHAVEQRNVFREDEVKTGLTKEQALANAPEKESGAFKVPKII
ncbi:MAG TPA: Asp-tRNA(Asn)/Glu-tRNA(Gln) amidotransferase subunit GatC [Actinobacteria bacterium]|nr:Asp-tRNA(Asn)/Glu-tRNA(Gln) amidotransferase subunit GatC [Actinomycetes bacterium]HEX21307.1 Asp-tRNA(Asn)/Glu-tRNA(Gln) amidotransferase subunit GatC [Actinomycetota bacterium]